MNEKDYIILIIILLILLLISLISIIYIIRTRRPSIIVDNNSILKNDTLVENGSNGSDFSSTCDTSGSNSFLNPLSMDIGGSLTKVGFIYNGEVSFANKLPKCFKYDKQYILGIQDENNEALNSSKAIHFLEFPTSEFKTFIKFVHEFKLISRFKKIFGTGGGSKKFKKLFEKVLKVKLGFKDEMKCLVRGLNWLMKADNLSKSSVFQYDSKTKQKIWIEPSVLQNESFFPYLFVQIGSGVSIVKVEDENTYSRVSGSALGGASFFGLAKLIAGIDTEFEDILHYVENGDNKKVDLLVGDIYGFDCDIFHGLNSNIVAGFFGKIAIGKVKEYSNADVLMSLIYMVGANIAQIACLNAKIYKCKNLVFSGGFMRKNQNVWKYLMIAVRYYSQYMALDIKAMFVKHHRFLGCLGCLLRNTTAEPEDEDEENVGEDEEDVGESDDEEKNEDLCKMNLDDMKLSERFNLACIYIENEYAKEQYNDKPEINIEDRLVFYKLYKQSKFGPASKNKKMKPKKTKVFDPTDEIKWQCWCELGDMKKKVAMKLYVDKLCAKAPKWWEYSEMKKYINSVIKTDNNNYIVK